ncbi:MAG: hypothetical protein LM550_07205 [Candidatus Contendobacter sp.]|jgi:hypothetical protein|nr:hypothetical protein [Gammaproteobacteria bacterium]MCC8993465.1 hypothetical protein [Candidatus Contendobacter sp.]
MSDVDPIIGNWYRNQETGNDFEVVALDEDAHTIEIQYFDGEIEELDLDDWYDLAIESIETPEDESGPFDVIKADDLDEDEADDEEEEDKEFSDEDDLLADRDED